MHPPITPETKSRIISALEKDAHASRVARTLGDVSYATVWRIADDSGTRGEGLPASFGGTEG
jgi:hypothetical protein